MKLRTRVLIDVDDVCGQFRRLYLDTIRELFGVEITLDQSSRDYDVDKFSPLEEWQKAQVWRVINSQGWATKMEPMPGAVEAIQRIAQHHQVSFITKPLKSSPTWGADRRRWISRHFGPKLAEKVHSTSAKEEVDGNFLIEDRLSYCEAWSEDRREHSKRKFEAVLFAWPYNEHRPERFKRFPDWKSIADYVT